jgi:phosphoribosyl-ATP pyrophosphohydrolase
MEIVEDIYNIIIERKMSTPEGSYVASLMSAGEDRILAKIEEESAEVIEATRIGTKQELIHEIADLIFHILVLMGYKDVTPEEIQNELKGRMK